MIDLSRLHAAADDLYGSMGHPLAPEITRRDYPAYEHVASLMGNTPKPDAPAVQAAHRQLTGAGIGPADFAYVWGVAQPAANRLLGRDPTMQEVARLREQEPGAIGSFYFNHPHPQHPDVSAGEMAHMYRTVEPLARRHAGRAPLPGEVARFIAGGYGEQQVREHYTGAPG